MKAARKPRLFGILFVIGDILGILILLVIGISGQVLALNPYDAFFRGIPVLSPQDWAGSWVKSRPALSTSSGMSSYAEKREFFVWLSNDDGTPASRTEINQSAVWYADPAEALAAWNRRDGSRVSDDFVYLIPDQIRILDQDNPGSVFYCAERPGGSFPICQYLAYWQHWYTVVEFWSYEEQIFSLYEEQFFSLAEFQILRDRVDQLLLQAPDRPLHSFVPWTD